MRAPQGSETRDTQRQEHNSPPSTHALVVGARAPASGNARSAPPSRVPPSLPGRSLGAAGSERHPRVARARTSRRRRRRNARGEIAAVTARQVSRRGRVGVAHGHRARAAREPRASECPWCRRPCSARGSARERGRRVRGAALGEPRDGETVVESLRGGRADQARRFDDYAIRNDRVTPLERAAKGAAFPFIYDVGEPLFRFRLGGRRWQRRFFGVLLGCWHARSRSSL